MRTPPPEIRAVLYGAALRARVPYTVLAAIAFEESSYNPHPPDNARAAQGLMQLTAATQKRFAVTDPYDPAQSARGAAEYLGFLWRGLHDWSEVYCAYVWGAAAYARAKTAGKAPPSSVRDYAARVAASRRWLQAKVAPIGASALERLDAAIATLERLNPPDSSVTALARHWQALRVRVRTDADFEGSRELRDTWRAYAAAYDQAAITDASPLPESISPALWSAVIQREAPIDRARAKVRESGAIVVDAAASTVGSFLGSAGGLVVLVGLVWVAASSGGRSRSD
jgi:hypothetical protein